LRRFLAEVLRGAEFAATMEYRLSATKGRRPLEFLLITALPGLVVLPIIAAMP
jgi:hypothetical protein